MSAWMKRPVGVVLSAGLLLGVLGAPPAAAYSSPDQVPDPFQDYSAQDYWDALWNLETTTDVRTHERESRGDCDVQRYTVNHPLELEPEQVYVHVLSPDGTWCRGSDGDELRDEFDAQDQEDENFHHGVPYENTEQRVPYYGTWEDTTGNGHHSRTEIHARDMDNSSFTVSGTYWDHYSGQTVDVGETETHAEHMIPVGHTWPEMQHRSREDRVAYYNDHMNLTSTIGRINREKSGHTPSEWMPSAESAHCGYAMTWTHISNKHEVSLFQRDVDHLRDQLWDCLQDELPDDAETLTGERSPDLDWQEPAPAAGGEITDGDGGGPRSSLSGLDLADALWNLENEVPVRSVERESRGDCDLQTYTVSPPRGGEESTYARAISEDNDSCDGEDGNTLREELDEQADGDDSFFHGSPLSGQRREHFGYWAAPEEGEPNTRHSVLGRDLDDVAWNSTETGVVSGRYTDPYTGQEVEHSGAGTQLDHILPVEHAWTEMQHRPHEERVSFHNDTQNLLAVPDQTHQERDAQGPRDWMPEHEAFQCRYAAAWVHTASSHEISLFASDVEVLRERLYTCLQDAAAGDGEGEDGEGEDGELEASRRVDLDWPTHAPQ